jgi:hypothetical protein
MKIVFRDDEPRKCGSCSLCCKLLPVRELTKVAGQRCKFQRHSDKGCCKIYERRPPSCVMWSCVWYASPEEAGDMRRPDRTHYVVDIMPDFVTAVDQASGLTQRIDVVQVWIDPFHPEAHRDPALRAYLARRGERDGMAAIIRLNSDDAWVLIPPALNNGQWQERRGNPNDKSEDRTHTAKEIFG